MKQKENQLGHVMVKLLKGRRWREGAMQARRRLGRAGKQGQRPGQGMLLGLDCQTKSGLCVRLMAYIRGHGLATLLGCWSLFWTENWAFIGPRNVWALGPSKQMKDKKIKKWNIKIRIK